MNKLIIYFKLISINFHYIYLLFSLTLIPPIYTKDGFIETFANSPVHIVQFPFPGYMKEDKSLMDGWVSLSKTINVGVYQMLSARIPLPKKQLWDYYYVF